MAVIYCRVRQLAKMGELGGLNRVRWDLFGSQEFQARFAAVPACQAFAMFDCEANILIKNWGLSHERFRVAATNCGRLVEFISLRS